MFLGPAPLPQLHVGTSGELPSPTSKGIAYLHHPHSPLASFFSCWPCLSLALVTPALRAILAQHKPKAFSCLQPFQGSPCHPKPERLILAHQAFTSAPASLSRVTCHPALRPYLARVSSQCSPFTQDTASSLLFPEHARLSRAVCLKCSPVWSHPPLTLSPAIHFFLAGPSSPLNSWQQPEHPFTGTLFCPPRLLQVKSACRAQSAQVSCLLCLQPCGCFRPS